jgi:hypothetical protein
MASTKKGQVETRIYFTPDEWQLLIESLGSEAFHIQQHEDFMKQYGRAPQERDARRVEAVQALKAKVERLRYSPQ